MPLSRLENFLKNAEGNILYVNPSDFDATDSFENRGNSLTRPFKTIQRAVLEASRFSFVPGENNDRIDTTTILVYPGTHYIDNRPGYSVSNQGGTAEFKRLLNGAWTTIGASIQEFSELSNFEIFDENNDLYKFNSVHGGVILPRGTSIVGLDLRKTKLRPLYIPDPKNDGVEATSMFKVTGTCYFTAFTIFDGDPLRAVYKDSYGIKVAPSYSHHKLTVFEYADGVNNIILGGTESIPLTDLDMYYAKVSFAYGDTSGRGLTNFPSNTDFSASIDESRIVGDLRADSIGISSIRSGNGVVSTPTITVITDEPHGLFKDTPVLLSGITTSFDSYNGSFIVSNVDSDTQFTYVAPETPGNALPTIAQISNAQVIVESDSVSSASPYIFSCTLRSVFGMNGMWADGNKATGFKSMLTAQFTGISLQKDDDAFILYDEETSIYNDNETVSEGDKPLHTNSRAIYRSGWESTHIKVTNNAIIQAVSVFAIGFARHFVAETGGDMSITNSNSNFGAVSLESTGFRPESFDRDDVAYITHVIPPRQPAERVSNVSWLALDVQKIVSAGQTSKLWIDQYKSLDLIPPFQIDSYRIGSKKGEELYLSVNIGTGENTFSTPVLMQVPSETYTGAASTSSAKEYYVGRNSGINSITGNILTLTEDHKFFNGEKVRIYSDTGETPNNVVGEKIYYVYTTGLNPNQIKLSSTLNDTTVGNTIIGISNSGGVLKVISSVSDKLPGEYGHPIQFDTTEGQWYIIGSGDESTNTVYTGVVGIGTSILGSSSGTTFVTRKIDNRGLEDRLYKMRYVIPKEFANSRPPTDGFVIQESKNTGIGSVTFLTSTLSDSTQLRNPKVIKDIEYNSGTVTVTTELPHNLLSGDTVKIKNVISTNNTSANILFPYNGSFEVYSTPNPRTFTYVGLTSDPGSFLNSVNSRSTQQQIEALPIFEREKSKESLFIYRSNELKELIPGGDGQDGVYNITGVLGSINPNQSVGFGLSQRGFNQDVKNLYPQQDRDNYQVDPEPTTSFAEIFPLGKVSTNDRRKSLTKEALNSFLGNNRIGFGITGVTISGVGNTTVVLYTDIEHRFNGIKSLSIIEGGSGYNNSVGSTTIYSSELLNTNIVGRNASVKTTVSAGSTVSNISIVDSGAAYGVGQTMTISAFPAGVPGTYAVVQVDSIINNVGDGIELSGLVDPNLNGLFKITSIPNAKEIEIYVPNLSSGIYTGRNDSSLPLGYHASRGVGITTMLFTQETGIATVTTDDSHGLLSGNTFVISGMHPDSYFGRKFSVSDVVGVTTFTFNAGITTSNPTIDLTDTRLLKSIFSANDKSLGAGEENLGGRGSYIYAGITTTLATPITSTDTTLTFSSTDGFKKGDFIIIDSEILRITSDATVSNFQVIRGQFSTKVTSYVAGTTIKKIKVLPVELRRPSILRASGHTFEYLGFGPGNYSTGLPVKQDRILSDDEVLIAQAREQDGGTVVYTGMNDRGEFFSGATKINGATGEEEIIEAPIVTFFGDDSQASTAEKRNSGIFDDLVVKERMTVEGGENNNQTSQFYGPVNFSQKVTSTSEEGLETRDLYIKGVASQPKQLTVGISTPTDTKKAGDIDLLSSPSAGGYLGHIYADGEWRRFGMISKERDADFLTLDRVGIGQSQGIYNFTDAMEVNGTLKVKNLYVGSAVTFAGAQAIGNASFEVLQIDKTAVFSGLGATNYSIITSDVTDIAQFGNMEVTGYAVTFTTPTVRFQNSFYSSHAGVSTIADTLDVKTIVCTTPGGFGTFTTLYADQQNANDISVSNTVRSESGIVTHLSVPYVGFATLARTSSDESTIVSLTGTAATITTLNSSTSFITNLRVNSKFATPDARINLGIITNFQSTNGVITNFYSTVGVVTTLHTGNSYGNNVYSNTGFTTTSVVSGWIGAPTGYVNSGIVTTISGTTLTYDNVSVTGRLGVPGTDAGDGIYANSGIITNFGLNGSTVTLINCGSGAIGQPLGIVTAGRFVSALPTGTSPLQVQSTTQVSNLNAQYVGGKDTSKIVLLDVNTWQSSTDSQNRVYWASGAKTYFDTPATTGGYEFRVNNLAVAAISADGQITAFSDERLKKNIKTIENPLEKVNELRGVEYDLTTSNSHQIGVIAQEVEKILPEVVLTDSEGMKSVAYGNLTAVLIEAVKELKGEITELKKKISDLESNK